MGARSNKTLREKAKQSKSAAAAAAMKKFKKKKEAMLFLPRQSDIY
ncbi:MAG: hypothetical protein RI901_1187 [Actinomycetota bacterium]